MSGEFLTSDNIVAAVIGALITVLFAPLATRLFHRRAKIRVTVQSLPREGFPFYEFFDDDIFKTESDKKEKELTFFKAALQASYLAH